MQAGIALLAAIFPPPDAPVLECQGPVGAGGYAIAAVVAAAYRPRIVAGFAAHIAPLQEENQAAARSVHAGEGDDFTD